MSGTVEGTICDPESRRVGRSRIVPARGPLLRGDRRPVVRVTASIALALAVMTAVTACADGDASGRADTHSPAGDPTRMHRIVLLQVGDRSLVRGPHVIRVRLGTTVGLRLRSTRPVEETLLVTGYGQRGELDSADGTLRLDFVADRRGSFPIVKEENQARLSTLVVT